MTRIKEKQCQRCGKKYWGYATEQVCVKCAVENMEMVTPPSSYYYNQMNDLLFPEVKQGRGE